MATVTVRPTADGALLENCIYPTTPTTHYDKVDEETPNDLTDYIYQCGIDTSPDRDSFVKGSTGIPTGSTINSVKHYRQCYSPPTDITGVRPTHRALLRNDAGSVVTADIATSSVWETRSYTWTTSPFTGSAWTLSEVEGLQIGVQNDAVQDTESGMISGATCSTIWLVIDFLMVLLVCIMIWAINKRFKN